MKETKYRMPVVAGTFYPSNPAELINQMDSYFSGAPKFDLEGRIVGLIVPHAGYIYSGFTAAVAYNLLKGKNYKTIIVLSPSHREFVNGISVYEGDAYITPLGRLDVDEELREELTALGKPVYKSDEGHKDEHAIEVQLPFLQRVLDDFKILPLIMRYDDFAAGNDFSEGLGSILKSRSDVLLVATTDLSHRRRSAEALKLDEIVKKDIEEFDPDTLVHDVLHGKAEACGCAPVATMLRTAKILGADKSKVLHRSDSSSVFGDKTSVVGYLSAVIWKSSE